MTRLLLSDIAPWFLTVMLGVAAYGLIASAIPAAMRWLAGPRRMVVIWLGIILAIGIFIRFSWVPNARRIYFDEDRYLMYAVSFARTGHALGIRVATPTQVLAGDPDPGARVTVPTIHAWVMRLFGYTDGPLFTAAKIGSALQIILLFALGYLLFHDPLVGLIAAAIDALLPVTAFWSTSTNLDSYFVLFGLVSAVFLMRYLHRPTIGRSFFLVAAVSLLLFVRIEGLLFIPIAIATTILRRKELKQPVLRTSDYVVIVPLVLILTARIIVALPLFTQTWCCAEATPLEIFQPAYIARNIIPNLQAFVARPEFPAIITVLAFLALVGHLARSVKAMLSLWIALYFFLYSCYYAGQFFSFTFSGSYGRFFLMMVPPLVLLAASTIALSVRLFRRAPNKEKLRMIGITTLAALTLYPTIFSYGSMIRISPWDALVDAGPRVTRAQLTDIIMPNIPANAVLIHPLAGYPMMIGRTIVTYEAFLTLPLARDFIRDRLKAGTPVYILHTDTCTQMPYKCAGILSEFTFTAHEINFHDKQVLGVDEIHLVK